MGRPTTVLRVLGDERRNKAIAPYALSEILRLQFDRLAVGRAVSRTIPCRLIALHRVARCDAFSGNEVLKRIEPVPVIGIAGLGGGGRFRALDFLAERRGPFVPGEQASFVQRQRHGKSLRFPGFAEHRAFRIAGNARNRLRGLSRGGAVQGLCHHVGSKYGSHASIETESVGSAASPHNSRASNSTV